MNVTSGSHARSQMHFDNLNLKEVYDARLAYARSKTANILMANEINRPYGDRGLHALSMHLGCIRTGLQRPSPLNKQLSSEVLRAEKSPAQGTATQVWGAVGEAPEGKDAKYLGGYEGGQTCRETECYHWRLYGVCF
jgi:NAD(P)-dependent dehydrogenase (short-subunit alcohol dehydrogenase family)